MHVLGAWKFSKKGLFDEKCWIVSDRGYVGDD